MIINGGKSVIVVEERFATKVAEQYVEVGGQEAWLRGNRPKV
jgi:hypothetical protein